MTRFRVAPIDILFATWPGSRNWRSFHANSILIGSVQLSSAQDCNWKTNSLSMNVDIVALDVIHEVLRSSAFDEGDAGASIVRS